MPSARPDPYHITSCLLKPQPVAKPHHQNNPLERRITFIHIALRSHPRYTNTINFKQQLDIAIYKQRLHYRWVVCTARIVTAGAVPTIVPFILFISADESQEIARKARKIKIKPGNCVHVVCNACIRMWIFCYLSVLRLGLRFIRPSQETHFHSM